MNEFAIEIGGVRSEAAEWDGGGSGKEIAVLRPASSLLVYYILSSFALGPLFPFALLPRFFRYRSLRYQIDREGIVMRWGFLFRREISLTFARIQDIHLSCNVLERWLGLGRIQLQTASGSAAAEMTIEGISEFEALRDFLYAKMRGARDEIGRGSARERSIESPTASVAELAVTLRSVAAEIRLLRESLQTAAADAESSSS